MKFCVGICSVNFQGVKFQGNKFKNILAGSGAYTPWFTSRGSKYKKTQIVAKNVVGLLLVEVVSTKKELIIAKDMVGLPVGDSKNDSEFN